MWWAAIDKQSRSWPDMAMRTKMIDKSGEDFRLPVMVPVMHGLCLLVISAAVLALFTFFDLFSLPGSAIYYGLSALLAGLLVLYILTSIAIPHSNERMKKLLRSNRKLQILAFISAIIVFVSLLAISSFK
jgi:hypothetical protein